MSIGGKQREGGEGYSKKVGLVECKVIAINPTHSEYLDVLGIELKEDSKAAEYLGESRDGNNTVRIDIWLEQIVKTEGDSKFRNKVTFFLEQRERQNKAETKDQYINAVGMCSWADDPNNLAAWFTEGRDFRIAYSGEEDLYNFLRIWLCELDYRHVETTLIQDWKKLIKGNVKDLRDQINGEWCGNVIALATLVTREKDDEVKEYQGIYNRAFLPSYTLKNFRLTDYSKDAVLEALSKKKPRDMKPHEKFVSNVTGEYGCKDFFILKEIQDYDPEMNLVASDDAKDSSEEDNSEY
jgi:hypothetical protein